MLRRSMMTAVLGVAVGAAGCVVRVKDPGDADMRRDGWEKLGERTVNGDADKDVIEVGRSEGKFRKLMIVVEHSDLEMFDVEVEFLGGETFSPKTRAVFKEGAHSHPIDLPGDKRAIKRVTFKYGNLPGGGKAQLELWGK